MAGRLLREPCLQNSLADRALDDGFMQMVPPTLARGRVDVQARGREHPLPRPLAPGVRILPAERPRQLDPARASGEVALVQRSRPLDVPRVEEAGLLRRRRPGFPGYPPRPSTTGRSRIPKGDGSLGANHRQFPRSQERKRDGSVTQDDHPKSWDGTLWASGERPSTRVARTETTLSCCCTIPSTRRKGSVTSAIR